jgi:hypothetical protein
MILPNGAFKPGQILRTIKRQRWRHKEHEISLRIVVECLNLGIRLSIALSIGFGRIAMALIKLLGYALGSVVMYWGVLLILVAPWALMLLVVVLANAMWNHITGKTEEWKWFLTWTEAMVQAIHRLRFEWMGWIPGLVIQIWYAGYAAHWVQTSALEQPAPIMLQMVGGLGVIAAAATFYGLYRLVIEVHLRRWMHGLVGGLSLVAYGFLLHNPPLAQVLSERWQQVFIALLSAMT